MLRQTGEVLAVVRLAIFEPDIPQNTGALLRLAACMGVGVDVIEPCGFVFSERRMQRAGMDYLDKVQLVRHPSWEAFSESRSGKSGRLILLTTGAETPYHAFSFCKNDTLLLGRESAGVPDFVHKAADARILVPMMDNMRSLNVAQAAAMVLGEALRQTGGFSN
jgi:tRNA (cytidine/uridine-2'-O-)-methyltransferase